MEKGRSPLVRAFVIDASVAAGWFIPDEANCFSNRAMEQLETYGAVVTDLLWHEMRSLLTIARRRNRIPAEDVALSMVRLRELNISTVAGHRDHSILELVCKYQLSAYDAAYLALALEHNLPLSTLDKQLIAAASQAGCALVSA